MPLQGAAAAVAGFEGQEGAGGGDVGRAWLGEPRPTERSEDRADEDEEEDTDAIPLQAGVKRTMASLHEEDIAPVSQQSGGKRRWRADAWQRKKRRSIFIKSRSTSQDPGAEA